MTISTVLWCVPDEFLEQGHDFVGALAVQIAGGLVAKQEGGVRDNGAGNGDALFLTAGKLTRKVVHAVGRGRRWKAAVSTCVRRSALESLVEQKRQLDILEGSEDGNQVVHLKDEADVAGAPFRQFARGHMGDLVAGDGDAAARGDVQAAEKIQQRGLAGTAGTHEGHEFALGHVQIQALEDVDLFAAAAIGFVEVANLDETGLAATAVDFDHRECSYFWIWTD